MRRRRNSTDDEIRALERKEREGPLSKADRERLYSLKARSGGVVPVLIPRDSVPDEDDFIAQAEAWAAKEALEGKRKEGDPALVYGVDLTADHDSEIFSLISEQAGFGRTSVEGGVAERELSGVTSHRDWANPAHKNIEFMTFRGWELVYRQIKHLVEVGDGTITIDDGTGDMSIETDEGVWYTGETEAGGFTIPPGVVNVSWLQPPATAEEGEVPTSDSVLVEDELEELQEELDGEDLEDSRREEIEARIARLEDLKNEVSDYVEGDQIREIRAERGWGAHLTLRGYMDQTEWHAVYATEREALEEMAQFNDVKLPDEVEAMRDRAYAIAHELLLASGFEWEGFE